MRTEFVGAALPGAIRTRDTAMRCEPASPKGHRNQHAGLDPASAQPPTKLTDAARRQRARGGILTAASMGARPTRHFDLGLGISGTRAGESPAIGQPFASLAGRASPFPSPARAVLPRRTLASHAQVSRVRPAKVGSWASPSEIFDLSRGVPTGPATTRRSA